MTDLCCQGPQCLFYHRSSAIRVRGQMGGWKNEQVACLQGGVVRSMDVRVLAVGAGAPAVDAEAPTEGAGAPAMGTEAPAVGTGEGWPCGVYSCGLDDIGARGTCPSPGV